MLNRQQPFGADVITPRVGDDDGRRRARRARRRARTRRWPSSRRRSCEEAGVDPGEVYEIVVVGNVTMMQLALGIDPEPLSMAPFIVAAHELPPATAAGLRRRRPPARPGGRLPVARRLRRRRHRRRHARDRPRRATSGCGCSSTWARTARSRWAARSACSRPPRPPGRRSRRRRSAAACAPPRARSRASRSSSDAIELQVIGDTEPVGMCGSGLVDCVAELVGAGLLDHSGRFVPDETAARDRACARRAADQDRRGARVRHALARRGPGQPVYLSQRDVRELQFAKASIATGWQILLSELGVGPRTSRRCCWPAASAPTCRPRARSASGSCRGWRCRGSSRPATSPARARRWPR